MGDDGSLQVAEEGRDVVVRQETDAYDELRASEVLLEVREQQVAEAEQKLEKAKAAGDARRIADAEKALQSKRQFLQFAEKTS